MNITERVAEHREAWKELPVHPAAGRLPMMSDEEIEELAKDIETNGLQEPIILWRDNHAEAKGLDGPFPVYLLDGRNRMKALELLGITNPWDARTGQGGFEEKVRSLNAIKQVTVIGPRGGAKNKWVPDTDPVAFVLSMNVHRRHLTREQKREAIKAYIEADPSASNRKVARELKVSHVTVAAARDDVQGGQIDQSEQATDRAAAALKANPDLTQRQVAKLAGVSLGTVSKASKRPEEVGGEVVGDLHFGPVEPCEASPASKAVLKTLKTGKAWVDSLYRLMRHHGDNLDEAVAKSITMTLIEAKSVIEEAADTNPRLITAHGDDVLDVECEVVGEESEPTQPTEPTKRQLQIIGAFERRLATLSGTCLAISQVKVPSMPPERAKRNADLLQDAVANIHTLRRRFEKQCLHRKEN